MMMLLNYDLKWNLANMELYIQYLDCYSHGYKSNEGDSHDLCVFVAQEFNYFFAR